MNIHNLKKNKKKWTMLTAYDAPTAELLEGLGTDFILIGDSLGTVVLGYNSTTDVTMDEMIHHAKAVRRGAKKTFLIGDLPLKGVAKGPTQALESARRFIDEAGCDAVKLEWNQDCLKAMDLMRRARIPVLAHIGLTPQSAGSRANFKVRGQTAFEAAELLDQTKALEARNAFGILMECIPWSVARTITQTLRIPTFGIGAGPYCDGQVLVFQDVVGLFDKFTPRFAKHYLESNRLMQKAVAHYLEDVRKGCFPKKENSYGMKFEEWSQFLCLIKKGCRHGA